MNIQVFAFWGRFVKKVFKYDILLLNNNPVSIEEGYIIKVLSWKTFFL